MSNNNSKYSIIRLAAVDGKLTAGYGNCVGFFNRFYCNNVEQT